MIRAITFCPCGNIATYHDGASYVCPDCQAKERRCGWSDHAAGYPDDGPDYTLRDIKRTARMFNRAYVKWCERRGLPQHESDNFQCDKTTDN